MGSISGSFSANGVSSTLALGNTPESISLTLAGTFSGKVYLERAMSTAAQAWEVVGGPYTAAGTFNYLARPTDILRARMKNYVSGTVSFTLSDGDATIHTFYDPDGNPLYRMTQGAHYFLGDVNITGNVTSGTSTLSTFGAADFFRFGYGATRPLVKMQSAGTDAAGAPQQVLSISHQVTHSGTGGAGAIGALYSASTIDGGPDQDYYAAAFTMTNRAKRSVTATPDQAQHGTLFTHQVKDLPVAGFSPGDVMADSWVQWWVAQDRTNLPSSQGGAFVGVEFDIFGNNQDDAVGKKRFARQVVLNNYAGDAAHPLEWGYGDYWNSFTGGAQDTFFNTVIALYAGWTNAAIDLSQGTGARSNPYVDGTNRGVAIKMRDGAKLSFNGDGATGSYLTRGSNRLQYWSGGAEKWSVSDAGDVVFSGGTFGPSDYRQIEINPSGVEDFGAGSPQILRVRRVGSDNAVGVAFSNLWVTRSSWVLTDTSHPAGTRFNAVFDSSSGAGVDPGAVWNMLATHTTSASEDSLSAVSAYVQMVRAGVPGGAKKGVQAEALVVEARDASGASSATGGLMRTLELDMFANGADDYSGAVGREIMPILLGKHSAGGAAPTFTSIMGVYPVIGDNVTVVRGITWANQLNFSSSLFDTRDSVQGANAAPIWLKSGHKIAFDGTSTADVGGPVSYLSFSGGAIRSNVSFSGDAGLVAGTNSFAGVGLAINGSSASLRPIRWRDTGVDRFALGMNGANSDLVFGRYLDTGTLKENALTITRKTGFVTAAKPIVASDRLITPKIQLSSVSTTNITSLSGNGSTITVGYTGAALAVGAQVRLTNNTPSGYDGLYVVATSTTNSFTAAGTATGTVTEFGAFILYQSMAQSWTGSTYPNDYAAFVQRYTPSGTPTSGIVAYNYFAVSTDTVNATNAVNSPAAVRLDYNYGTNTLKGGRFGVHVNMTQTSAIDADTGVGPIGGDFIPGAFHITTNFNAGGTGNDIPGFGPNVAKGGMYALYPQILAGTNATFFDHFVGAEWDFQIKSAPNHKMGQHIVLLTGDSAQGVYDDIGFSFNAADDPPGWKTGLAFGRSIATMGMDPAATLIDIVPRINATHRNNTAKHGVNYRLGSFTGSAFTSQGGFDVLGTGDVNIGPTVVTRTTTAGVVDVKRFKAAISGISTGGALYSVGDEIYILGGVIRVDTVAAGVVTAASIIKDIYQDAAPANPQGGSGGGGGNGTISAANQAKFNFTWTQVTGLSVQPSGGATVFGGSVATPAPVTKTTNFTMGAAETSIIANGAGTITVTLPSPASSVGQWRTIKTIAAQTVVSASSNVSPQVGGAAGTAILAATAGKWADLQSDGTNWIIMRSN